MGFRSLVEFKDTTPVNSKSPIAFKYYIFISPLNSKPHDFILVAMEADQEAQTISGLAMFE